MRHGLLVVWLLVAATQARARVGTGDPAAVFRERPAGDISFVFHGHVRARSAVWWNADLGVVSPTGQVPLFPTNDFDLVHGHDLRARFTPSLFLGEQIRLFGDVDLAQLGLGTLATGATQQVGDAHASFVQVRALGLDWMLPIGTLSIGRTTSHFGLGIGTNNGADVDDDGGDVADRISFIAPAFDHLFAVALDVGPGPQPSVFGPSTRALSVGEQALAVGVMRWMAPWEQQLHAAANDVVWLYGAALAVEWASESTPGLSTLLQQAWSPTAQKAARTDAQLWVVDVWSRLLFPHGAWELEAWFADLHISNPSPFAGLRIRQPLRGNPWAVASQLEVRVLPQTLTARLHLGAASADDAAGVPTPNPTALSRGVSGDVFGPQIDVHRGDLRVDAARLHPLHREDLLMWRTLLGGISEAAYVKLGTTLQLHDDVQVHLGAVYSHALTANTIGGVQPLGIEADAAFVWTLSQVPGLSARVDAGVLQAFGGLAQRGSGAGQLASMGMMRLAYEL
jgi:uncharacterized protein (TIGR04551 family)